MCGVTSAARSRSKLLVFTVLEHSGLRPSAAKWSVLAISSIFPLFFSSFWGPNWLLGPDGHQAGQLSPKAPQPGVLSQDSSARFLRQIPEQRFLSQDSSAKILDSRFLSQDSSAKIPQQRLLSEDSSARVSQPTCVSHSSTMKIASKLFGVARWSHLFCPCLFFVSCNQTWRAPTKDA